MRRRLLAGLIVVGCTLVIGPGAVRAQEKVTRLPIVDKAIEFHGGDLYESSVISLRVESLSGGFDLTAKLGEQFAYTVSGEVGREEKYLRKVNYTNDSVQEWRDGVEQQLDEQTAQRARDFVNARAYFPFLPYGLNGDNVFKEDLGLETWEGRQLHKVRVSFRAGTSTDADDTYMYWFDPETGRVEALAYDFKVGNGGLRFRKPIAYQKVGGILYSDQENYAVNGQGFSVDLLTPEYIRNEMKLLSTVRISNIKVEPHGS